MRTVELANGAVYPVDWCGAGAGNLYINIPGDYTVEALTAAFSDAAATQTIVSRAADFVETYTGYTQFVSATSGGWTDGATLIWLMNYPTFDVDPGEMELGMDTPADPANINFALDGGDLYLEVE